MKFWQLVSVTSQQLVLQKASEDSSWKDYESLARDFRQIVNEQDRQKLDLILADGFVATVLVEADRFCYLGAENQLRSWRFSTEDKELSFLDVFQRYGGDILEEVCEKGSVTMRP